MTAENLVTQPFLDWYGVWPGHTAIDENGEVWSQDRPVGVSLRVQEARKSEIFIHPEHPWEQSSLSPICVLEDEGLLKLWYYSGGPDSGETNSVAYAESDDGFNWRRP